VVGVVFVLLARVAGAQEDGTRVTLDTMLYHDSDHTDVLSSQVAAAAALDEAGGEIAVTAVVDMVSAASVDVISEATPGFTEVREEADVRLSKRVGDWLPGGHYRYSHEPDYISNGGGVTIERRLGGADTVLDGGLDLAYDLVGRHETSFTEWGRHLWTASGEVGVTQVIDTKTVVRGAYTLRLQEGYLAKPYRQVPLFDETGLAAAARDGVTLGLDDFDRYRLPERPPENVPGTRLRHALGLRGIRYVAGLNGSLRLDYRIYADDWGIWSHTVEAALRTQLSPALRGELKSRTYYQTAAWFWERTYTVSADGMIPEWRTVDKELTRSLSETLGAGVDWRLGKVVSVHGDLSGTYEKFYDYLFLDSRFAVVLTLGAKVTP
jgi:hypothetical protein